MDRGSKREYFEAIYERYHVAEDLVSHSGDSASGEFIYSLNQTDIQTTWVETRAVLGKKTR